jgi:RIO-like serine/threonine protein kinase
VLQTVSSQADTTLEPAVTPAELQACSPVVLKSEGDFAACVLRYDLPGRSVVVKRWTPKHSRLMRVWARLIMRREIRHYRLLDGTPGVPRYLGHEGDAALYMQFIDALPVHRQLPPSLLRRGLDGLEHTLDALHARRFVHLDLHQKLNALIDPEGRAWVIDLGQGLDCSRGPFRRLLFPALARIDRNAVVKFRARYAPDTLDPEQRDRLVARYRDSRNHWLKRIARRLRRSADDSAR